MKYLLLPLLLSLAAAPAFAEDSAAIPATLNFQYSGLKWSRTQTKYTGSLHSERSITSLLSGDLVDSSIWATIAGKVNIYFYPFQDANTQLSVGYMLKDTWELGIDIGLASTRVDSPKSEVSSDLHGAYTIWTLPFQDLSVEHIFIVDFSSVKSTAIESTSGSEDTSRISGSLARVSSSIVLPIAKNAYYVGGLWIAAERTRNHTIGASRNSLQFGLMLAGLRIAVE